MGEVRIGLVTLKHPVGVMYGGEKIVAMLREVKHRKVARICTQINLYMRGYLKPRRVVVYPKQGCFFADRYAEVGTGFAFILR
jgi:hypothetical protein